MREVALQTKRERDGSKHTGWKEERKHENETGRKIQRGLL